MELSGAIEKLIGAEIEDPAALVAEAKERITEYFERPPEDKWQLCSPTYRSKYSREKFIEACEDWFPLVTEFEILNVALPSGILATATVEILVGENHRITRNISLIRERGPYDPDPGRSYSIVGQTAPPYSVA